MTVRSRKFKTTNTLEGGCRVAKRTSVQKGTDMVCLPQIKNCVVILNFKHNQGAHFPINCGISVTVPLQYLDTEKRMEICVNGIYTRMLRMVKGVSWKDHMTNQELYGDLPKITDKITVRRMRLAVHCM